MPTLVEQALAGIRGEIAYRPRRDELSLRATYDALCEDALDYYVGGAAQRLHLSEQLRRRLGETPDPRKAGDASLPDTLDPAYQETDSARIIRQGRMELVTVPLVRSVVDSLAVLYAADDLERVYLGADGKPRPTVAKTMESYHRDAHLAAKMHQEDAYVVLLRTSLLLVRWCTPLRCLAYDVIPPHWVHLQSHPEWPLDPRLAYQIVYAEAWEATAGREGETVWCMYQRPPLDIDPEDAPTRATDIRGELLYPKGRFVRYTRAKEPWPAPTSSKDPHRILDDGPNPLVEDGGMQGGRCIWSPLVWHWAEPPTEDPFLAPQADLVYANLELDVGLTWLQYLANLQSHGQAVMKGSGALPPALGPSTVVRIDDAAGDFTFASPAADLQGLMATVQRQLQVQAMLRHLSPDTYSTTRPSVITGPAKLLEQYELLESRWRRTLMADQWERDRFEIERLLHNRYGRGRGEAIPDDVRLEVRWGELRVPHDRNLQVQRIQQELAAGLTSRLEAVMEVHGLDREAATARITEWDGETEPEPTEGEGAEPTEAEPDAAGAEPTTGPTAEQMAVEADMKAAEQLVKLKAPAEMVRPLLERVARTLGIATTEVLTAIGQAEFRWYTEVQAAISADNQDVLDEQQETRP